MPHLGSDVDQRTGNALHDHPPNGALRDEESAFQVQIKHGVIVCLRDLGHGLGPIRAGIVHDDVERGPPIK
jgi:hypothetical protein